MEENKTNDQNYNQVNVTENDNGLIAQNANSNAPKKKNWLFYLISSLLALSCIAIILANNFLFLKIIVDGHSMENTLQHGDIVTASKALNVDYGDIIVIDGELVEDGISQLIIKRAIAFGGDTVKIEGGYVYLKKAGESDFTLLDESSYVKEQGKTFYPDKNDASNTQRYEVVIPEGEIFYLGDNRMGSSDSRYADFFTCKTTQVIAVVSDSMLWTRGINKFINNVLSK